VSVGFASAIRAGEHERGSAVDPASIIAQAYRRSGPRAKRIGYAPPNLPRTDRVTTRELMLPHPRMSLLMLDDEPHYLPVVDSWQVRVRPAV